MHATTCWDFRILLRRASKRVCDLVVGTNVQQQRAVTSRRHSKWEQKSVSQSVSQSVRLACTYVRLIACTQEIFFFISLFLSYNIEEKDKRSTSYRSYTDLTTIAAAAAADITRSFLACKASSLCFGQLPHLHLL